MPVRGNRAWLVVAALLCSAVAQNGAYAAARRGHERAANDRRGARAARRARRRRARGNDVRARRRRALALVERAVPAHHRPGLRFGGLDREAMLRVHDLLRASLSSQGYQKVAGVIRLDDINRAQQVARLPARRDRVRQKAQAESFGSGNYFVLFFGDPRRDARWGWLLQGHHLAVSFTVADGKTAFLPMFVGATPLAVDEDVETGWSALAQEVTRGVELVTALTESQTEDRDLARGSARRRVERRRQQTPLHVRPKACAQPT